MEDGKLPLASSYITDLAGGHPGPKLYPRPRLPLRSLSDGRADSEVRQPAVPSSVETPLGPCAGGRSAGTGARLCGESAVAAAVAVATEAPGAPTVKPNDTAPSMARSFLVVLALQHVLNYIEGSYLPCALEKHPVSSEICICLPGLLITLWVSHTFRLVVASEHSLGPRMSEGESLVNRTSGEKIQHATESTSFTINSREHTHTHTCMPSNIAN